MAFDFTVISIPFTSIPPITFILPKVLLFYNSVTLPSLVMRMNDDHARIGILIVLPLFDG